MKTFSRRLARLSVTATGALALATLGACAHPPGRQAWADRPALAVNREASAPGFVASSLDAAGMPDASPVVAPAPPQGPGEETADASETHPGPSASAWLEIALDALQNDRPEAASTALHAALATGDLNDAGRTLAYWYVYVAEQAQNHGQNARNALADFVVVGQDVLALRHDVRFAERGGSDFVDRFDLEGRLARSRAMLSLAWAAQVPSFGRSPEQAVPVRSSQEMAFFLELAPPCAHRLDKQATEEVLSGRVHLGAVTRVNVSCEGLAAPTQYYFATGDQKMLAGSKKVSLRGRKNSVAAERR